MGKSLEAFGLQYFNVLHGTFKGLNLTGFCDFKEFYQKQILDSVLPLLQDPVFVDCLNNCKILVDVGFGGGFPLLPLAFLKKDVQYIGIESKNKKVEAVKIIAKELGLTSVKFVHERLENIHFDKKCLLTFKAVGKCKDYLEKIKTNQEIYAFFYKGPKFYSLEGERLKKEDLKKNLRSWEIIDEKFLEAKDLEGRWMIGFKKNISLDEKNVSTDSKRKLLVNLSQFL